MKPTLSALLRWVVPVPAGALAALASGSSLERALAAGFANAGLAYLVNRTNILESAEQQIRDSKNHYLRRVVRQGVTVKRAKKTSGGCGLRIVRGQAWTSQF